MLYTLRNILCKREECKFVVFCKFCKRNTEIRYDTLGSKDFQEARYTNIKINADSSENFSTLKKYKEQKEKCNAVRKIISNGGKNKNF